MKPTVTKTLEELASFLASYASWMIGCGATCIRTERNTQRMSEDLGVDFDITILPSHIHVSVTNRETSESYVVLRPIVKCGTNFNICSQLSKLSWEVADQAIDFDTAVEHFGRIIKSPPTSKYEVLILTSLANASFCRLFGGDVLAMVIVFASTLIGCLVKQIMLADKYDVRLTFLCCSFFSAVLSAVGLVFDISCCREVALATSVLFLIPGVPYINAVSDMIYKHYLMAFYRFVDAAVLTICLSVGLCAGHFILDIEIL